MIKLAICGNYGATNLGDEAVLFGILNLVRSVEPQADITVLSANPSATREFHDVKSEYLLPAGPRSFVRGFLHGHMMKTFKILQDCDAFIIGGGGLFTDEKIMAIIIWSLQAGFASVLKKPMFCLGQSVGPLNTFFGRHMTKNVFKKARALTVRDSRSQETLHGIGISTPEILADPAFAIHFEESFDAEREDFVVFSLRPWRTKYPEIMYKYLAHFIDWLWLEFRLKSVLVPFSLAPEDDTAILNNIFVHVKEKGAAEVFEYTGDYRKIIQLMTRAKAVIGMRLHSLIFAAMTQTPFLALSYSDKVAGLTKELEMSDYLLNWDNFDFNDLKALFRRLTLSYEKISLRLGEKNILLRAKAREHEPLLRTFFDSVRP